MTRKIELLEGEQLMSIAKAAAEITGTRPHPTTCNRWVRKGVGGIVLPSLVIGGRRMTTVRAFREWINETTEAAA